MKTFNISFVFAISMAAIQAGPFGYGKKEAPVAETLQPLNEDFLVGFETGIFLRKTPE